MSHKAPHLTREYSTPSRSSLNELRLCWAIVFSRLHGGGFFKMHWRVTQIYGFFVSNLLELFRHFLSGRPLVNKRLKWLPVLGSVRASCKWCNFSLRLILFRRTLPTYPTSMAKEIWPTFWFNLQPTWIPTCQETHSGQNTISHPAKSWLFLMAWSRKLSGTIDIEKWRWTTWRRFA